MAQTSGKAGTSSRTTKATPAQTTRRRASANRAPTRRAGASVIGADQRHAMIAETAFYYAEQRGFQGDMAMDDWLRAEAEIDARIAGKRKPAVR